MADKIARAARVFRDDLYRAHLHAPAHQPLPLPFDATPFDGADVPGYLRHREARSPSADPTPARDR